MKWRCALAATALLLGCPSSPQAPRTPIDSALRLRIAQAEAQRSGGVSELIDLATHGDSHTRALARRALGRIGTEPAIEALTHGADDPDPEGSMAAVAALGVAASLDDGGAPQAKAVDGVLEGALVGAKANLTDVVRERGALAAIEALGRAGNQKTQEVLVGELGLGSTNPAIAEAAAIALGRHGRRKIELDPKARAALIVATGSADRTVRYAAVYALAREQLARALPGETKPVRDHDVEAALAARIVDENPQTRAQAISGLAKRGAIDTGRTLIEDSLRDRDWRVAVEAVRALAGDHGDDNGRDAVAAALLRRWTELVRGDAAEAQVVTEGLRLLAGHAERPLVAAALTALATSAPTEQGVPALTRGWIECLAIAALARASGDIDAIATCGHGGLPDHLRLPLLAALVTAGAGDPSKRRAVLRILLAHADPRIRAAGLGALAATWKDGDAADHANLVGTVVSALGVHDPIVAGSAVDAAPAIYDAGADKAALDAAVVARARVETEVELSASLYDLIGKRAIASGADACRAGLTAVAARAHSAAACLKALGEPGSPSPASAAPPPVDVAAVINHNLRWHLVTTRGEIVIELRPDVAPWNVATIVALTRKHFYDGLEVHRVVPNFVAQGGDPTMSGWGGPGFTTPAEPGSVVDRGGFDVGGVGIADAGRDSGGSQWFVMHARAAHLDGRYTWIGMVVSGQKSADALLIGDRVLSASVEIR